VELRNDRLAGACAWGEEEACSAEDCEEEGLGVLEEEDEDDETSLLLLPIVVIWNCAPRPQGEIEEVMMRSLSWVSCFF